VAREGSERLSSRSGSDQLLAVVGAGLLAMLAAGLLLGGNLDADVAADAPALVRVDPPGARSLVPPEGTPASHMGRGGFLGPKLARGLRLRPRPATKGGAGLIIVGAEDGTLLEAAGLKLGDVLTESDGAPLGTDGLSILAGQFASLDTLEVMIERDGRQRRLTLLLRR
jgi:hypothetical protein